MKTVAEVKAAAAVMAAAMTALVQSFEDETGCIVHSLPVRPANDDIRNWQKAEAKTSIDVKVQLAG